MSARLMGEVFELDVNHAEQAILLALTDHADDQGMNVFPSIGRIAWKTGYSKRQVQRIMDGLRQRGVLQVLESGSARDHRAVTYRVDLSSIPRKKPYGATPMDKMSPGSKRHQASDTGTTRASDTGDTRLVSPVSPEPSLEPSVKTIIKPGNPGGGATAANGDVDETFVQSLIAEFPQLGDARVRRGVTKATNNRNYLKARDRRLYVHTWIAEDAEKAARPPHKNGQPNAEYERMQAEFGYLGQPRNSRYRGDESERAELHGGVVLGLEESA